MENYIKMKYLLIFLLLPIFGISQDWSLTQDEILQPQTTVSYENVYLNGYTIEMKNGSSLSITNLYGGGSIVAFNSNNGQFKPALSICSYDCNVTPIDFDTFGNQSIPLYCDSTLNVSNFELQEQEKVIDIIQYGCHVIYIIQTKKGIVKRIYKK